eukprot:CAMPEP_0195514048 /NCGR_PEP_ID=MMETSP0794_2-20130614/5562_1 /TAXON_ID=515487 /ORGANISM="Stephanopyxis turris, Strain CCMP 815" /LENGTH=539 /DNA_ID=CAMNT_0040642213 /DNA_START=462 /DNA_END=2081 /DNA_ORIENTATION=+
MSSATSSVPTTVNLCPSQGQPSNVMRDRPHCIAGALLSPGVVPARMSAVAPSSQVSMSNNINIPASHPVLSSQPVVSQLKDQPANAPGAIPSQVQVTKPLTKAPLTKGSSKSKSTPRKSPAVTMSTASNSTPGSSGSATGAQGENTGRWTAEEHRLFLQGLDQHGKGWKKIASLIKSRTVVQIRTHAQKYFQKLAKARQNGEEGDVSMEGRGMMTSQAAKKKRQLNGTKRKSISSVVSSVTRENKNGSSLPPVAPALAPYIVIPAESNSGTPPSLPSSVLEDSLYRFLTPGTGDKFYPEHGSRNVIPTDHQGPNKIDSSPRQASTNCIKVPQVNKTIASHGLALDGECSPTTVTDISFPTFGVGDAPQWYSKGAEIEDLLEEADTLDWLADSGDLDETYSHMNSKANSVPQSNEIASCSTSESCSEDCEPVPVNSSRSVNANDGVIPALNSTSGAGSVSTDNFMMALPALTGSDPKRQKISSPELFSSATEAVEANLPSVTSTNSVDENFAVFDSAFDEQAFVSALLESNDATTLPALG